MLVLLTFTFNKQKRIIMFDDIYVDFSRSCRIDADEVTECISHDVGILLECYEQSCANNEVVLIPFYMCTLPRKKHKVEIIYKDITSALKAKDSSHLLIDMMPLVDSYLEYMCV